MIHGPQLITFTRAREQSDCWKDGHLQKQVGSPANRREKEGDGEGEDARSFYESLLASGESSSLPRKCKAPLRRSRVLEPPIARPEQTDPRRGNLLLRSAQEGDMGTLQRLLEKEGCDVNYRDGYYWTAVMCAAYAGQGEAVRYLLTRGAAWVGVCESQGRDAVDLAEEAGHQDVVRILQERETAQPEERMASRRTPVERKYCTVCQTHYSEDSVELHERSTAHLFNRRDPLPPTRYHIPESNVGFQLMVKGGWDCEAGLGPEGTGRKFPVQTVLKRDQKGLGFRSDLRPKVTHFNANDPSAVARPKKQPRTERAATVGKREARRREAKAKAWERDLRTYMNLDL